MINESFELSKDKLYRTVSSGSQSAQTSLNLDKETTENDLSNLGKLWWELFLRGNRIQPITNNYLNIVDLFCSAGGLSLGAYEAALSVGFKPRTLFCSDSDNDALNVYTQNFFPFKTSNSNVASLVDFHIYNRAAEAELAYQPVILNNELAQFINKVDLLIAGPPCQGHSSLNNHTRQDDPRNHLYLSTASIAIALKAKAVVIENVSRVLDDKSQVVQSAKAILNNAGYTISDTVLNANDLGAGQSRKRHFLVATKTPHLDLLTTSKILKKPSMTLGETIGDLLNVSSNHFMDTIANTSEINMSRINHLFDNDLYNLPNQVRPDCHKDGNSYPSVYGRLYWDKPSPTLTTGFTSPGRGRYVHPLKRRVLTPREAARIQGFPDWFDFSIANRDTPLGFLTKWIGDAVPSVLGYTSTLAALSSF